MFLPKYTITSTLLSNIKRITELVTELNGKHFPNVVLFEFERKAREISVYSSTSIEGNPLPLTDVKHLIKNSPEHVRGSEREIINYNNALMFLNRLDQNEASLNLKFVLEIQKIITNGLVNKFNSGKIRQEPVFVNNPINRKTIYFPPDHQDVLKLIDELIEYINNNKNKVDPLILAGIFHKQFVIIHPFVDGNGRTTRLITKMLLSNMGLNTFNLFSFENYYNNNVTKYFQNVGLIGNYYDIKDNVDFTSWLEYFTDGIIDELLRVGGELNKIKIGPEEQLQSHHQAILNYIKENGFIKDSNYAKITKRARPTRYIDFEKLIALGLIERQGKGKNSYYVLKNKD
ncbi:MAG: Fic family protein [Candidatus Pacebacteria bacterium]|nr:Fic family protein [Candidatus Paceibacterota bacterium]MDD5752964.1 Fic family protein [Candidatus Paceibacterota bacterium]